MITVFGSINLDLVVAVPRLPTAGETVSGPDHQVFAGGKGANQALAARRAGAQVSMVGAVGTDTFADLALENMKRAGVDLAGVRALDGATGLALIGVDQAGENQIIVASGANARVDAAWLGGAFLMSSILMLQGEAPFPQVQAAMNVARQQNVSVFWNPAPVPAAVSAADLDLVDTLVVNETEALEMAEALGLPGDPEAFIDHVATPSRRVVVTLGANGVVAGLGDLRVGFGAPEVDVADTTGAGDAFCGALAAALDEGIPFKRAIRHGVAAGALACTVTGAQQSSPLKEDIERLAGQIVESDFTYR